MIFNEYRATSEKLHFLVDDMQFYNRYDMNSCDWYQHIGWIKRNYYIWCRRQSVNFIRINRYKDFVYKCSFCIHCMNSKAYFNESFMMKMKMMNYFCGMVARRKKFSLISSRDQRKRSSPMRIFDMPQRRLEPMQNLSSDFVKWRCAVVMTIRLRHQNGHRAFRNYISRRTS